MLIITGNKALTIIWTLELRWVIGFKLIQLKEQRMMSFKYGIILLRYSSSDSVLLLSPLLSYST